MMGIRNALRELRQHPARLVAVVLAVAISVAFVTASLVFTDTETRAIGKAVTARTSASDVVVGLAGHASPGRLASMAAVPGVAHVEPSYTGYAEFSSAQGAGELNLDSLPRDQQLRWSGLSSGAWPRTPTELTVDSTTARQYGLSVGQQLTFAWQGARSGRRMRVTGITDESRSLFSGLNSSAVVDVSYFTSQKGVDPFQFLVVAADSTTPGAVASLLRAVLPPDSTVQTADELTASTLAGLTRGADVFRYLLLVFGGIAMLVGAILITNTFAILVVQRRRQIGLLRAVGASAAQVRRGLLVEAVLVGAVGSLLGVALGIALGAVGSGVTGSLSVGLAVPPIGVLAAAGLGVVVTVLAAWLPAGGATRIAPLEALRPVADELTSKRRSARWRNVSFLLMALGAVLAVVAVRVGSHNLVLAIAGSMVLAVGILLAAPTFLPPVLRLVGAVIGSAGPAPRLATANARRNPSRVAATCTALMLGVGLIVTLQVGAASIKSTVNDNLDGRFPVDVTVTNPSGPLAPQVIAAVTAIGGLTATTPVRTTTVSVRGTDPRTRIAVAGLPPGAAQVVAAGFERLGGQVVLGARSTLQGLGVKSGEQLRLSFGRQTLALQAQASDIAQGHTLVVTDRTLAMLNPRAPITAIWGAAADRSQAQTVMANARRAGGQQPGLQVGGSLEEAAALDRILDSLLAVATGLLGVAVLIALIGVGNTLGLSVLERTRESALLRALGLQRRDLSRMLAIEATVLALVGAGVGIVAGALFGWIGTVAVVAEANLSSPRFSLPVGQLLAVVAVAVLASLLASVIPGRRAALASPTEALADV